VFVETFAPGFGSGALDAVTLAFSKVEVRRGTARVTVERVMVEGPGGSASGDLFGSTKSDAPLTLTLDGRTRIAVTAFSGATPVRQSGSLVPGPVTVTAPFDASLLALLNTLATNRPLDSAVLSYADDRGTWTLTAVAVTSIRVVWPEGKSDPYLVFTLVPRSLTAHYNDGTDVLPLTFSESHTILAGTPLLVPVDTYGDGLTLVSFTQGSHGSVALVDGRLVYTPEVGFFGPDVFTYTIGNGAHTATVRVRVTVEDFELV
jgi:hypothetical protein